MKLSVRMVVVVLAVLMASGGCRKKKRNFVPAPKPEVEDPDDIGDGDGDGDGNGDGDGDGDGDRDGGLAAASGDGGPVASGDGDGDAPTGDLSRAQATELLGFLEKELPAGIDKDKLFTKLARKCSTVAACAPPSCRSVLASCTGGDVTGCGTRLLGGCSAFSAVAQGAQGEQLKEKTDVWLRDLWGDLLVKLRLSLPESKMDRVDELAERHQL